MANQKSSNENNSPKKQVKKRGKLFLIIMICYAISILMFCITQRQAGITEPGDLGEMIVSFFGLILFILTILTLAICYAYYMEKRKSAVIFFILGLFFMFVLGAVLD